MLVSASDGNVMVWGQEHALFAAYIGPDFSLGHPRKGHHA
jgi:hypothetical protein